MKAIVIACLLAIASCANWAVLVAGSNEWMNYRHQSNLYHNYKVLIENGFPADHIITMAYNDLANDYENPFPGQIFNKPDGPDVYQGFVCDYEGEDVNVKNWEAIMLGDKSGVTGGSGRVLESTSEDNVYVLFDDHGDYGLIAFPDEYMYSDEFTAMLKSMYEKNMYKKMVFYMEACYGGSMWKNIVPEDWHIYATTSANDDESSYGTYCGDDAVVQGVNLGTCLGGEYVTAFLEDLDTADLKTETLADQYAIIQKNTPSSHPGQYGDLSFVDDTVDQYFAGSNQKNALDHFLGLLTNIEKKYEEKPIYTHRYSQEEATIKLLKNKAERTGKPEDLKKYKYEVAMNARSNRIFKTFSEKFNLSEKIENDINFDCYRALVGQYKTSCGLNINRDTYKLHTLGNYCSTGKSVEEGQKAIEEICSSLY